MSIRVGMTIFVPPSTRLYADSYGGGPGKTLGELTGETRFPVKNYIPGRPKPILLGGDYTDTLGWVSL